MNNLSKLLICLCLGTSYQHAYAEDIIYTWQDEQENLVNYAGIPPDDQIGSDNLRVFIPKKGTTTGANLPPRTTHLTPERITSQLPPMTQATPTVLADSTAQVTVKPSTVIEDTPINHSTQPKNQKTNKPRLLSQGNSQPVNPAEEMYAQQKIKQKVNEIERNIQTAQQVAERKRLKEMQILAERVRNGAATQKEIAALITYRQTASFKNARKAMKAPKN